MRLPLSIARKLVQLANGAVLPASAFKHALANSMLADGLLVKYMQGRGKAVIRLANPAQLPPYLANTLGIQNLRQYIDFLENEDRERSVAVQVASNSKLGRARSFSGFLVATLTPVTVQVGPHPVTLQPVPGVFTFIEDYRRFTIPRSVTVVGIENAANFTNLPAQQPLFEHLEAIFVCRYPTSSDLTLWLQSIPNDYLHFGDLDFSGVQIFLSEYYEKLGERAELFVPANAGVLLQQYGNASLYNRQAHLSLPPDHPLYHVIQPLLHAFHRHKKCLEQEIFIEARQ